MKKHILLFLALALCGSVFATSTEYKPKVDNYERKYLEVLPANFNSEKTYPLITFLHPNGMNADEFSIAFNMQMVADMSNSIVLVPEALGEQNDEINSLYDLASQNGFELEGMSIANVWNAGVSFSTDVIKEKLGSLAMFFDFAYPGLSSAGKVQFNKDVDDVSFLNNIIDYTEEKYKIHPDSIFMVGASMGGAMTYKYAYSENTQVKGIAVICGFIGSEVDDKKPLDMPVCIFHSVSDSVVKYNGGIINRPIESYVENIVTQKGADYTSPKEGSIADIANDGISIKTFNYCKDNDRVAFYKMSGATHADFLVSDYVTGPNDMDYYTEVYKFLFKGNNADGVEEYYSDRVIVAPTQSSDYISSWISGVYEIYSHNGELIKKGMVAKDDHISISNLAQGVYLLTIRNNDGVYQTKIVKK